MKGNESHQILKHTINPQQLKQCVTGSRLERQTNRKRPKTRTKIKI